MNLFDTAQGYGFGASERLLGEALRADLDHRREERCSGGPPTCRGRLRSTATTGPSATQPIPRSIRRSSTSCCGTSRPPPRSSGSTRHRAVRPPGLFALYVAGYCGFRIFDELLRVDTAAHVLGLRWNLLVAIAGTAIGVVWFVATQRPTARQDA